MKIYEKAEKIIESCLTNKQLYVAETYVMNATRKGFLTLSQLYFLREFNIADKMKELN